MHSLEIKFSRRFLHSAKTLSKANRAQLQCAIDATIKAWGNPHLHAGVGIRRLKANVFEARCGLKIRLVFFAISDHLIFFALGNHDEIRRIIKSF